MLFRLWIFVSKSAKENSLLRLHTFDNQDTPFLGIMQLARRKTDLDNLMVAFPDQKSRGAAREREREKF